MKKLRFSALLAAIMLTTLTACTTHGQRPQVGAANMSTTPPSRLVSKPPSSMNRR